MAESMVACHGQDLISPTTDVLRIRMLSMAYVASDRAAFLSTWFLPRSTEEESNDEKCSSGSQRICAGAVGHQTADRQADANHTNEPQLFAGCLLDSPCPFPTQGAMRTLCAAKMQAQKASFFLPGGQELDNWHCGLATLILTCVSNGHQRRCSEQEIQ